MRRGRAGSAFGGVRGAGNGKAGGGGGVGGGGWWGRRWYQSGCLAGDFVVGAILGNDYVWVHSWGREAEIPGREAVTRV